LLQNDMQHFSIRSNTLITYVGEKLLFFLKAFSVKGFNGTLT